MAPSGPPLRNQPSGDPAVRELQAILVQYGYMTEQQLQTGVGILGPKTRAAVDRLLEGKGPPEASGTPGPVGRQGNTAPARQPSRERETSFYIVQAGDTPEAITRRLGVTLRQLEAHPENAFMQQRKRKGGYPLHPGDRLAIPGEASSRVRLDEPSKDSSTRNLIIDYLSFLTRQHPSSLPWSAQQTQSTPPGWHPPMSLAPARPRAEEVARPTRGYTRKHPRIWPKVVLTAPIESAFLVLLDYLPRETVMTSGYRSDADQERIINEYYAKHNGNPMVKDVEQRRQWLITRKGLKIARVGSSPHRTGLAFDLSGGDISTLDEAVKRCAREQGQKFPLLGTIIERNQNCLHVNLKPSETGTA
jgi:peptidoglycan hydrolase-like protein with peptidoglycan-binding domain